MRGKATDPEPKKYSDLTDEEKREIDADIYNELTGGPGSQWETDVKAAIREHFAQVVGQPFFEGTGKAETPKGLLPTLKKFKEKNQNG